MDGWMEDIDIRIRGIRTVTFEGVIFPLKDICLTVSHRFFHASRIAVIVGVKIKRAYVVTE